MITFLSFSLNFCILMKISSHSVCLITAWIVFPLWSDGMFFIMNLFIQFKANLVTALLWIFSINQLVAFPWLISWLSSLFHRGMWLDCFLLLLQAISNFCYLIPTADSHIKAHKISLRETRHRILKYNEFLPEFEETYIKVCLHMSSTFEIFEWLVWKHRNPQFYIVIYS